MHACMQVSRRSHQTTTQWIIGVDTQCREKVQRGHRHGEGIFQVGLELVHLACACSMGPISEPNRACNRFDAPKQMASRADVKEHLNKHPEKRQVIPVYVQYICAHAYV